MKAYLVTKRVDDKLYSNIKKVSEATDINYFRLTRAIKSKGHFYDGEVLIKKYEIL